MSMPNAENLAPQITRRVAKELSDLHANPPEGITVLLNEQNVSDIQAEIEGPVGTPYQGGHFHVKLVLGKEFPSSPPKGFFITKIFHPNVSRSGEICVNTLKKDWKEDLGIKHILLVIKCLLIVPNPESALNEDAAKLLLEHYDDYCKRAKMITEIHAMRPVSLKNVDKVMNIDEKLFSSSSLTIESVTRRPLEDENSKGPQAKKHAPSATQSRTDILKTSVANLSNPTTSKEMINRKRIFRRNISSFGHSSSHSKSPKSKTADKSDCEMKKEMNAFELKDEGNKYFALHKYDEAIGFYSRAISLNQSLPVLYTNRALCLLKQKNWTAACDDCRRALELDSNMIKGHYFLGQGLLELGHYDESILHLQRAFELSKESKLHYGDDITHHIRLARKKRWNALEEKRINQEIELQSYLNRLMIADKEAQIQKLHEDIDKKTITDDQVIKNLEQMINTTFDERIAALSDLFAQVDDRRKKRDVPDYLCGKISFEVMQDPVITPSGITYDRKDIVEHLHRVGHFDPVTRNPLTANQLIPNLAMKEVIDNFLMENEWANDY